MAEPVEATPQITTFGKNILKHTLHQFASEFPLCFLKNIGIIKNLCVSKIKQKSIKIITLQLLLLDNFREYGEGVPISLAQIPQNLRKSANF